MKKLCLALAVLWAAVSAFAASYSVTVAWDASTDPSITGYNVYYGSVSRAYTNVATAGNSTTLTVSNLVPGVTYYLACTCYTAAGLESDYSTEVSFQAPSLTNVPPTLDPLPDLTFATNDGPKTVQLTGITSGSTDEIQPLTVSVFAGNPTLLTITAVNYTSPNTNGSFTFSANGYGSSPVSVMVDDGGSVSNTVIRTFMVVIGAGKPPLPPTMKPLVLLGSGPVVLPAGAAIDLEAPNANGVPSGFGSTYARWLDVSGNHYDAYCRSQTATITNVGGHQAWSMGPNDGWIITNTANSVVQNLTGCTMVVTVTGATNSPVQNVSYVAVPADNSSNFSWISQAFPQTDGQVSLDFRGRRLGPDSGVTVAGPGVALGVRYVHTVTVNWATTTVTCYTNGVQIAQNTNFQTPGNSDNFGPAQGIALMCYLQGGTPANTFTGTLENFVLWPRVLTTNELAQVYGHFK